MGRCMFVDPAAGDGAKLSGGSWSATLPLSNLQDERLAKVARSSNAALGSTKFDADLKEPLLARAVALVAHNLSRAATVRFRASHTPDFGLIRPTDPDISAAPWSDGSGTPAVTRVTGPDGKSSGYNIDDNDGAIVEYRQLTLSIGGGNGTKEVGIWIKKGTATASVIVLRDSTAVANRLHATITWSGNNPGTPSMGTGTYVSKHEGRDNWWYLRFTTSSVTVANTNLLFLYGASDTGSTTGTTSYAFPAVGPRNLVLDTNISGGNWTDDAGAPSVSVTTGPFGAQDGYLIYDDSGAVWKSRIYVPVFSANGQKSVNVWVKKGSSASALGIELFDVTAGTDRLLGTITWSGTNPGTPSMSVGTFISKEEGENGWWLMRFLSASATAANSHNLYLRPVTTDTGIGSMAFALPWVEEASVAYEDRHAGQWKDVYQPFTPGPVNLLESYQDLTAWTKTNTPVVRAGYADPFGGNGAYLVEDDDGAASEHISQQALFRSDGTKAVELYVRQGTLTACDLNVFDSTETGNSRHHVRITFSAAGVPSLSTVAGGGTLGTPVDMGNGWYRITFTATGVVSAHRNSLFIYPHTQTAATTGTVYVFRPLVVDAASLATSELEVAERGYTDSKVPQWLLDDGYDQDVTEVTDENIAAQFWRCEIDDTANTDGYVEIGRLMLGFGYEPSIHFSEGLQLSVGTTSRRTRTDGGAVFHREGVTWRECACALSHLEDDEVMVRGFSLFRRWSTHGQFYFIYDWEDTVHMHRRAFPATFGELPALTAVFLARLGQPFKIVEVI